MSDREYSHARARVFDEIIEMMTSCRWRASKSHAELAEKHNVSVHYVKKLATEAGRWINGLMAGENERERDAARGRILARMEALREDALSATRVFFTMAGERVEVPAPDRKLALDVDELELKTIGAMAPVKRQEVPAEGAAVKDLVKAVLADERVRAEVVEQLKGEPKEEMH